jgi:hypothetical protein
LRALEGPQPADPQQPAPIHFVRARVRLHEHPHGTIALFWARTASPASRPNRTVPMTSRRDPLRRREGVDNAAALPTPTPQPKRTIDALHRPYNLTRQLQYPEVAVEASADQGVGCLPRGTPLREIEIDTVFIGSCTNGRIEDLREVARVMEGRRVKDGLRAMIVPGSGLVRAEAGAGAARRQGHAQPYVFLDGIVMKRTWAGEGGSFGGRRPETGGGKRSPTEFLQTGRSARTHMVRSRGFLRARHLRRARYGYACRSKEIRPGPPVWRSF